MEYTQWGYAHQDGTDDFAVLILVVMEYTQWGNAMEHFAHNVES